MVRNMRISPFEACGTFDSSGSSVSKSAPPLDSSRAYVRGVVVGTAVLSEGLQTQGSPFKAGNNVKLSAQRSANASLLGMYKPSCCLAQVWFTSPHFRSCHMAFPGIFSVILRFGMVGMVSSAHGQTHNISQSSSLVCFLRLCWWHIIIDVILLAQASQPPFNSNWGRRWRWQAANRCTWLCTFLSNALPPQARSNKGSTLAWGLANLPGWIKTSNALVLRRHIIGDCTICTAHKSSSRPILRGTWHTKHTPFLQALPSESDSSRQELSVLHRNWNMLVHRISSNGLNNAHDIA